MQRLTVVLLLNLGLITALVIAGLATHSLAVLAAGADYLADAGAIGVSLLAIWLAARPPSRAPSPALEPQPRRRPVSNRVLVAGGAVYAGSSTELYHPATGTWTATGSLNFLRFGRPAWLLPNGQVLAAGGETQNNKGTFSITASAELYTP